MQRTYLAYLRLLFVLLFVLIVTNLSSSGSVLAQAFPYPRSAVIEGVIWDFDNLVRLAPGSDLWPVTWAADGNLYTAWGDGGGFGGTNADGRVSLGFARIQGSPTTLTGVNIWGGKNTQTPATFQGKSMGMLSVEGVLYAWVSNEQDPNPTFSLAWSTDLGVHWQQADWGFAGQTFGETTFLNFGQDYAGARDEYVYIYGVARDPSLFWTKVGLARVPKDQILERTAYEFYTGLDESNMPQWTRDINQWQPVFEDPNGVGITAVSYNPGLDRYLLTTGHGPFEDGVRRLGIFDAPEPWGPWTTVAYNEAWGGFEGFWLGYYIPTKTPDWMSPDGQTIHLIFSGQGTLDSFNLIKGSLKLP
jgi:hypothetical protein